MRLLQAREKEQRGCIFCNDSKSAKRDGGVELEKHERVLLCKWDECPYHELDNIRRYKEYEYKAMKDFKGLESFLRSIEEAGNVDSI